LIRNYNQRKRDFGLMLASGYPLREIRKLILSEQVFILFSGLFTGLFSAIPATLPTIRSGAEVPWIFLGIMIVSVLLTGLIVLFLSVRTIENGALIRTLRKE
jgi:ABC-type antimicrobial peptide transport system permease subunit